MDNLPQIQLHDNLGGNIPFWVKLTTYDPIYHRYAWVEQQFLTGEESAVLKYDGFKDMVGGRSGTIIVNYAWEANRAVIVIPSYALIQMAYYQGVPIAGESASWTYIILYSAPCCNNDPAPVPSYWYCLTPPSAQWYCVEPPEAEGISCLSCTPDTIPSIFDVQIDDLDAYIPGASASMVVTVEHDPATLYWTGRTYFNNDRAFVQIRITCGTVPGIFYAYFDVGPFDAFGFSYTGGVDTPTATLVCSPFSYSGTAKILVNNGFDTYDSGFVATLTMPV